MIRKKISNYKDLVVWQKSISLNIEIYKATKHFPKEELYGLVSQIRRSAISISSNIAEGYCRGRKTELKRFLKIAYASAAELETQLIISQKIGFLSLVQFNFLNNQLVEILKMLSKMISNLYL